MLTCVYIFMPLDSVYLTAQLRHPQPESLGPFDTFRLIIIAHIHSAILAADAFQLWLNHAQRQFAGKYKLSARVGAVVAIVHGLQRVGSIVGHYDTKPGFTLSDIVRMVIAATWAWQARVLPAVVNMDGDEE
jgi:hypothetical protein